MSFSLGQASVFLVLLSLMSALPVGVSAGDDLATVVDRTSHRASSFDETGGNNDNIMSFEPGKTHVLLDADGPGKITHFWFTVSGFQDHPSMLRDLVLRIYWENSKVPSVEAPLGDFFGLGHGKEYNVHSQPINVGSNTKALNCYWPMPFYKHARVELTNVGTHSIRRIFYNIDYELGTLPPRQGLFHAEFRRVKNLPPQDLVGNTTGKDNYVILDAQGEGQYVGCFLFVDSAPGGWWGEGDEMMFFDGEEKPSIIGTGTEDYFCNAWGFNATFNYPYYGVPLKEKQADGWLQTTAYRLHIPDPVRFKKSLRVTIEHGWGGKVANDYSSVAFWYQLEPNARRQALPQGADYAPRTHVGKTQPEAKSLKLSATQVEPALRGRGVAARAITTSHSKSLTGGVLEIDSPGKAVEIPVMVNAPGKYRVVVRLYELDRQSPVTVSLKGGPAKTLDKVTKKQRDVNLGEITVGDDLTIPLTAESASKFALDAFLIELVK